MRSIKLMADYGCFPLWEASSGAVGNINPETLPISESLMSRLVRWSSEYDSTLNMDDPLISGFSNPGDQEAFNNEGADIVEELRRELGVREWEVKDYVA